MTSTTKKKHVCREVLDELVVPSGNQSIVRVIASRGNNLHEVVDERGESYLVSMPTKFRKSVWIKRGDFVIVDPIAEGDKVRAEISSILYRDQIRHIKSEKLWPSVFEDDADNDNSPSPVSALKSRNIASGRRPVFESAIPSDMLPPSDDEDDDEEFEIFNPNRPKVVDFGSSDEDDDDEENEDNEEDEDDTNEDFEMSETMTKLKIVSTQSMPHYQG